MKKVRKMYTIQDSINELDYIFYNFYVTDLLMHKQGVVYELEGYAYKTTRRLKMFFVKLRKIIKKLKKESVIKILQKKEDINLKLKYEKMLNVYSPEKAIFMTIYAVRKLVWEEIKKMLENSSEKKIGKNFFIQLII